MKGLVGKGIGCLEEEGTNNSKFIQKYAKFKIQRL